MDNSFIAIAVIALLGAMSPGPDFFLVMKNSLVYDRRVGFFSAVGIFLGIFIHIAYSLLGIGLIISQSIILFSIMKYCGAAYLIYIGLKSLKAKKGAVDSMAKETKTISSMAAVREGFLTNALNPKVSLFFMSVFTVVISADLAVQYRLALGVEMAFVALAWFTVLTFVLTNKFVRKRISSFQHIVEKFMGAVLVFLGIKIATATTK